MRKVNAMLLPDLTQAACLSSQETLSRSFPGLVYMRAFRSSVILRCGEELSFEGTFESFATYRRPYADYRVDVRMLTGKLCQCRFSAVRSRLWRYALCPCFEPSGSHAVISSVSGSDHYVHLSIGTGSCERHRHSAYFSSVGPTLSMRSGRPAAPMLFLSAHEDRCESNSVSTILTSALGSPVVGPTM